MIQGRRALPIGLLALALGGGGAWAATAEHDPQSETQAAKAVDTPVVDCQTRIQLIPDRDPAPLRGRRYLAAGPVTFSASFRKEPRRQFEPRRGRTTLIKAPIFVEAGPPATISLSPGSARRAEIVVGLDRGGSASGPHMRLVPCPPDATVAGWPVGPRTPFIGGYRIEGPMCMRVSVLPDGAAEPIRKRIAFGNGTCRRR